MPPGAYSYYVLTKPRWLPRTWMPPGTGTEAAARPFTEQGGKAHPCHAGCQRCHAQVPPPTGPPTPTQAGGSEGYLVATQTPRRGPVGVEGRVKMIYGGMPFGWSGAPGEYMIFALAARSLHESYGPHQPETNGPTRFSSEWLMDDSVAVEPLIGTRPWQAVDCMGYAIQTVWGEDALNLSKQIEEGTPGPTQIVWGLHMDMRSC